MTKKLCTFLLSAVLAGAAFAQDLENCSMTKDCASFAPKKGQWEFSMMLGKSKTFYDENTTFLLPNIGLTNSSIGLPNGGVPGQNGVASGFLNSYLNINGFNDNSLVNILGVQGKFFWQDCWSVSLSGGMSIGVTPSKNYIEPTILDEDKNGNILNELPASKYVNATATNNWFINLGTERYFKTGNKRIFPYVGVNFGFQMARIETNEPYTGNMINIGDMTQTSAGALGTVPDGTLVDQQVYIPAGKIGQMFALRGAALAGVEYNLMPGMFLALEFNPLSYRYDVIQIAPQGFGIYSLNHHNIKIFEMPTMRIGFRF